MKEEMCTSSRVSLAINEEGQTLSMNKDAHGGISYSKLHDVITVSNQIPFIFLYLLPPFPFRWLKKFLKKYFTNSTPYCTHRTMKA